MNYEFLPLETIKNVFGRLPDTSVIRNLQSVGEDPRRLRPLVKVQRDKRIRELLRGRLKEDMWTDEGRPSPVHLKLLEQAYSPTPKGLLNYLLDEELNPPHHG